MASLTDTIEILIRAQDQTGAAFSAVGSGISSIADGVQGITGPMADLAKNIVIAEAAIGTLAIAIGTLAVKEAVQFEDSLYSVQKQLGDSGVSIEQARKDIEALGLTYGTNANEVAGAVAGFLAAGHDYETASQLVVTATQLMIAGQLDAQTATDAINKSLAGFRVPAEDAASSATKVGDVLNKIGDISSGKFEEIVRGFTDISPTAKDAGLTMEQTAAYTAVLVDVFGSGSEAATSLKSGLLSLLTPSKEAEETLKKLGVSTTDSNGTLKSANTILEELAGKWGGLTDAQKLQTAAIVFGKEQAGAMNTLLGDWGKGQDYVAQMLDKTTGAVGSMAREVEGKLNLISTQVDVTAESWRQFMTELGTEIISDGSLSGLIQSVGKVGLAFKEVVSSGGFDELIDWVQANFADLDSVLQKVAENLPAAFEGIDWSGAIEALDGLKDAALGAVSDLFGDVDITTVDGLRNAIQFLVDSFESLTRVTTGVVEGLRPFVQGLRDIIDEVNNSDEGTKRWAGEVLGLATGINTLLPLVSGLGTGLNGVGLGLQAIAAVQAIALFSSLMAGAGGFLTAITALAAPLAAGAAALGTWTWAVKENINAYDDYKARTQAASDAQQHMVETTARTTEGLAALNQRLGTSYASMDQFNDAANSGAIVWDTTRNQWVKAGEALSTFGDEAKGAKADLLTVDDVIKGLPDSLKALAGGASSAKESFTDFAAGAELAKTFLTQLKDMDGNVLDLTSGAMKELAADLEMFGLKSKISKEDAGYLFTVIEDGAGNITYLSEKLKGVNSEMEENAKKAEEATRASAEYLTKMEEIASNERIKTIEATVQLKTAQFEADATRVAAAFSSIGTTVSSTGDVLGTLFQSLTDANTWYEKSKIAEQIDLENSRREDALELQEKLVEAEIKRIEAQTERLTKDDAMIKIDATGLEPEIEAFMWKILGKIQTRANASMQDYLLGIEAAT